MLHTAGNCSHLRDKRRDNKHGEIDGGEGAKRGTGAYGDLHGLRLRVQASGARQWHWRGTVAGKRRDVGLGSAVYVTLAEARELAFEYTKTARAGGDPRALRVAASVPTFAEAAERTIELHRPTWRSARTEPQWRATLRDYAYPVLGELTVDRVTTADVLAALSSIWHDKPAVAGQVRTRIGAVLRWAIAEGHRTDDPTGPALTAALPRKNGGTKHHDAVPHGEMAGVLSKVQAGDGWAGARGAVLFVALTASRAGEVCGMTWAEVDGDTWTVPAERAKTAKPHRVPLSRQALDILHEARVLAGDGLDPAGLVFPSARGLTLSSMVLRRALRAGTEKTVHGLRSSFRSWAADSGVDRELAEAALAHVAGTVERAYQRSDLHERRRDLMQRWADYIMPK